jgi:hypothetical protein
VTLNYIFEKNQIMIVQQFNENAIQYKDFQIWDVENMDAFFNGNGVIQEIFEKDYKTLVSNFDANRTDIADTNMEIMVKILDQIGDKHFMIFTLHDKNHLELVQMQRTNAMTFGINIEEISPDHVYIMIMDKHKEVNVGM